MNTSHRTFVGSPWVLTILLLGLIQVCPLFAAGIVLTKKHSTESETYWEPVEFAKIERFPTSVVIETKNKQSSSIPVYSIGKVVEFIDFTKVTIITSDHLEKLKTERGKVATVQAQCKRAEPLLAPVLRAYDTVLQECANGNALLAGNWVNRHEFEAKQREEELAARRGAIPVVTIGSKSFKNVRVKSVSGERIGMMHDDGISSVAPADVPGPVMAVLKAAFPKEFEQVESPPASSPSDNEPGRGVAEEIAGGKEEIRSVRSVAAPEDRKLRVADVIMDQRQMEMLKDRQLGAALETKFREAQNALEAQRTQGRDIEQLKAVNLDFKVLRKLEKTGFPRLASPQEGLFEIFISSLRTRAVLVTTDTQFTSEGLASLWVVKKNEISVKLETGFDSVVPVFGEVPADVARLINDYIRQKNMAEQRVSDIQGEFIELLSRQDALEYAENVFPLLLRKPTVKVSKKLMAKGFRPEVIGKSMHDLSSCVQAKDWDKFYQVALDLKKEEKLKEPADVKRVIDSISQYDWKIVLQAKGFVFPNGPGDSNVLERENDNQRAKMIAVVVLPASFHDLMEQKPRNGLRLPEVSICNERAASLHPEKNGIIYRVNRYGFISPPAECTFCFFEIFGSMTPESIENEVRAVHKAVDAAEALHDIGKTSVEQYAKAVEQIASGYWEYMRGAVMNMF